MVYTFESLLEIAHDYENRADQMRKEGYDGEVETLERRAVALRMLAHTCTYAPNAELPAYNNFLVDRAKTLELYPDRTFDQ